MISILIDEISASDLEKISGFLEKHIVSTLNQIFWVRIPDHLLSDTQFQHHNCQPHVFAVELGPDWVKLEFFIRSLSSMQCACLAYCTVRQRDFIISFAYGMLEELGVKT